MLCFALVPSYHQPTINQSIGKQTKKGESSQGCNCGTASTNQKKIWRAYSVCFFFRNRRGGEEDSQTLKSVENEAGDETEGEKVMAGFGGWMEQASAIFFFDTFPFAKWEEKN